MTLGPSVRSVMTRINRKFGDGTVIIGSEIIEPVKETITSGSLSLDVALGGGWAVNHWNEIVGHPSAGKTMVVLKTIAANQKLDPNWTVVWFAAEDFVEEYAKMMDVDLGRVIIQNDNAMETVYQHAKDFLETREVDCIVIDSLPALVPIREMDGEMVDFQPGLAAFITGKFFRTSNQFTKRSLSEAERPVTGFVVNQWRSKIGGYGDPRTTPGGGGKDFFYFQRVDVQRDEWIKNTRDDPVGQVLKIRNLKNKYSRPGRIAVIDAYFAKGNGFEAGDYDLGKDAVSAGIAYGIIEQGGGGYFTFEQERWRGRPAMHEAVRADKKLQQRLRNAVLAVSVAGLPLDEVPVERPKKKVARGTRANSKTNGESVGRRRPPVPPSRNRRNDG